MQPVRRRKFLGMAGGAGIAAAMASWGVSCGGDDDDDSGSDSSGGTIGVAPGQATAAADIKLAAKQELTVRQYDEPTGLDPATVFRIEAENVALNIYSGLTAYDPVTAEPIPDLAESWTISPDGKVYTFKLRTNAEWQGGFGKFTSADVKYSYERILEPATKSTYRAEFNNVATIDAPSPDTVVITLKAPDANFLYQVGNNHQGQIVKKEAVEKFGDQYLRNPIGTGPFQMTSWTPNSEMILEAHDGYYKGKPTLRKIKLVLIKDPSAAETALKNKEVDLAMSFSSNEILSRLSKDASVVLHKSEGYANNLMIPNPDFKPFSDARVRQAIAYAIDNEAISKKLNPFTQSAGTNILPPFMPVFSSETPIYKYDPAKAKALLKEAGYEKGFSTSWILTNTTGADEATQLRQSQLAEVGIDIKFELMDTAVWNKRRNNGEYELTSRLYPAVNPDTLLFGYLHPDNIVPKGLNGAKYNNPELTAKLEAARAETNAEKRKSLYAEVQKIAMTDLPYIPLATSNVFWAGYPWVKGIVINKLASVDYFPVKIEEHA